MTEFTGVDHASLSVTDLDRSERFYSDVLGLIRLADFGTVRILLHRPTSFVLALARHAAAYGDRFTELHTGLDHLGFGVGSREELVAWERRLDELGVEYTPIRDMEFGAHLNFRDPDHIALELSTSNETLSGWFDELRERELSRDEIDARLAEHLASR
ncbi:MAG: VOC family protein [Nocardioides sp.]|uniref:VOC family protein n=1 Tax=Nocardioides sp. TaxID=35761 RepID=UPI0032658095